MKKLLFLFILAAMVYNVKAQQTPLIKPADSLNTNQFDRYFQTKPNFGLQFYQPQVNANTLFSQSGMNVATSTVDHMTIAYLPGNSKMPVAKVNGDDDKMVLKLGDGNNVIVAPTISKTP